MGRMTRLMTRPTTNPNACLMRCPLRKEWGEQEAVEEAHQEAVEEAHQETMVEEARTTANQSHRQRGKHTRKG